MATKQEQQWMSDIVELGCVACRNMGLGPTPAEVHHLRSGVGKGQRSKHERSIPLCPAHHRTGGYGTAFHAGPVIWQKKHGHELELLEQTIGDVESMRSGIIGRAS